MLQRGLEINLLMIFWEVVLFTDVAFLLLRVMVGIVFNAFISAAEFGIAPKRT